LSRSDPLPAAAGVPDVRREAAVARDDPLEPEDLFVPDERLARVGLFAVAAALRLARLAPLDAVLRAPPPPLFALLPAVFRPVCFRELLVVAKGSPFQDYSSPTPHSETDNRCKGSAVNELGQPPSDR
jgi:hypothetical protein